MISSPIPSRKEIGNEEAVFRGPDHWIFAGGGGPVAINDLCRRHGFSEASYYLWRSKFGGMTVPDAKRLKALEQENTRLKKLLAEALLEQAVTQEVLRKKW